MFDCSVRIYLSALSEMTKDPVLADFLNIYLQTASVMLELHYAKNYSMQHKLPQPYGTYVCNYVRIHIYIHSYILFVSLACEDTINCSRGSQCKVDKTVHQAYCEASCDFDNGGCTDDEVCSLQQQQTCTNGPCPPVVQCLSKLLLTLNSCIDVDSVHN